MVGEIQLARTHIDDYLKPFNASSGGSGALHRTVRKIENILLDYNYNNRKSTYHKPLTKFQLQAIYFFNSQIKNYIRTSHEFTNKRENLIELYSQGKEKYLELKKLKLNNKTTAAYLGSHTQKLKKLETNGTIYPYQFKGLKDVFNLINERGIDISNNIIKEIDEIETKYWNIFNEIKSNN